MSVICYQTRDAINSWSFYHFTTTVSLPSFDKIGLSVQFALGDIWALRSHYQFRHFFYSLTWNIDLCPWPSNVSRVKTYQHAKHLSQRSFVRELSFGQTDRLVKWQSGKTSVFGRQIFLILRSTCSWWVTTYVGKPSATGQSTRPTQPFILSRSINWVVSSNRMLASSHGWRRLVNAYAGPIVR